MAKKPKQRPSRQAGAHPSAGARLDVLLPRDWPQSDAPILWRRRTRTGESESGKGGLETLPSAGSVPLYLWTPATETLLTQAVLPTSSRAKLAQALPYALEEQLLDDPANLHFAWRRDADGRLSVAVTAKERVRNWLAALERTGLRPAALCPATLSVPWSPDSWSAAFVGDELLVRTGPASGFTCEDTVDAPPPLLLANLKEKQNSALAPEYFIVFQPPAGFQADSWSSALGLPVRVEPASFWDTPGDSEPALNLLQGDFARKGEVALQLRPWLPAAIMLGLWLVGTIAFDTAEWWQLNRRHSANQEEMTRLLMSAFPETKTVLDPYVQMQRSLDALQARGGLRPHDMLPMLSRTAPAWRVDQRTHLRSLRYSERSILFEITAPDTQTLERFRQALQSGGLQAETIASNARANVVEGRVRVRPSTAVSSAR